MRTGWLLLALALGGCGAGERPSRTSAEDGGTFTVLVIPPAAPLDWTTPNSLATSSARSKAQGELDRRSGAVATPHPIGHLMVALDCPGVAEIPVTGQTGGGSELTAALDGLGASLRTYPGFLDDAAAVAPDLAARKASGQLAELRFRVTAAACRHLAGFLAEYKGHGAETRYGGQFRPRRLEGGGCTSFALAFVEVGGLLKRSAYTPAWAREVRIAIGRLSDVGGDGAYDYGSNLIAHAEDGSLLAWPAGQAVRTQTAPIRPLSPWLDAWRDERDAATNVLPDAQPSEVPWTVYDPALVDAFVRRMHAQGGGAALGRTWTVARDGNAPVLETDATDAAVQAYFDAQDDLWKD